MYSDQEQRPQHPRPSSRLPILIGALVLVAVGLWFFTQKNEAPSLPTEITPPIEPAPMAPPLPEIVQRAPDIPDAKPKPVDEPLRTEIELPSLDQSDDYVRSVLTPISDSEDYALWLQEQNLLPKVAAVIDSLARGNIFRKVLPFKAPEGKFSVVRKDDRMWLSQDNYSRYNGFVDSFTALPPDLVAEAFHQLRPLLEEAFKELGNPPEQMDNTLITAIDLIIATPVISTPIALKRETVAYQFADPALESLSPLQKQLIRMGPDNQRKLQQYLRQIREALMAKDIATD